jgi:hypothetical protein
MNKITLIYLGIITLTFGACKSKINIDDDDVFVMSVVNTSIEDFDSYTLCKVSVSKLSNKKIVNLFQEIYPEKLEIGDGSTFANIAIYDQATDTLKYEKDIDFGTNHKKAKEFLDLLEKECEDGVIKE